MYHLDDRDIIGLCYRTLDESAMTSAAAHLAWCASCRSRADSFGASLAALDEWETEAPPSSLLQKALEVAEARRAELRPAKKALRAAGVFPGDTARWLRLAVTLSVALMLFAVGAGAAWVYLAESWRVDGELRIHASSSLLAGAQTAIKVEVLSDRLGQSAELEGIPVSVELVNVAQHDATVLRVEGKTGPGGVATLTLPLPAGQEIEKAALLARATVEGEERTTRLPLSVRRELRMHLSLDKPTYQPGQVVHLRALAFDRGTGLPASGSDARFEIYDPRGTKISRSESSISPEGTSASELELAPGAALGEYRAVLTVSGRTTERTFKVERYNLPPFTVTVKPLVHSTDGKDPFEVEVKARYTFGEDVSSGTARLEVSYFGEWVASAEARIKDGAAKLTVELPSWVAERARYQGGVLSLRATVIDPASRAEEGRAALALTRDTLLVDLHSEARSLRRDLPVLNRILIRTTRPDGSPVAAAVRVLSPGEGEQAMVGAGELVGEVETRSDGIGFLDLPPAYFGRPLATLVTDPADGHQLWKVFPAPPVRTGTLILRCDRALLRATEAISCDVYNPDQKPKVVRADISGFPVAMVTTPAQEGISVVEIPIPDGVSGLLRIEAEGSPAEDAMYALVAPKEGLRVDIAGNVAKQPGEETTLTLRVTDDQGRPRVAAVGLALVDAAVFARAGGETPRQVVEALFGAPGVATEMMALLFPAAAPGEEGGRGQWTAAQQVEARWLLSGLYVPGAYLASDSSRYEDERALSEARETARDFSQWADKWATVVVVGVLFLTLLVYSFWFRSITLGLLVAFSAFLLFGLLADEVLEMRGSSAETFGMIAGFIALLLVIFWRYRMRPDPYGIARDPYDIKRDKIQVWAVAGAAVLFNFLAFGMLTASSPSGGMMNVTQALFDLESQELAYKETFYAPPPPPMAAPSMVGGMADPKAAVAADNFAAVEEEDGLAFKREKTSATRAPADKGGRGMSGGGGGAEVRVREDFPETLYYNPAIVTDESGKADISFRVADSITTWEIYAFASDAKGAVGTAQGGLEVFQEFFVDLDVPRDLTVGDELALQVAVYNYQEKEVEVSLSIEADEGVVVDPRALAAPVRVPAQGVASPRLPLLVKLDGSGRLGLTLTGEAAGKKDAIRREVDVVPNGREVRKTFAGLVTDETSRKLSIPEYALADGRKVELTLFGSPIAQAFDGLDLAIAEPHGCFEQVSSTTYPNALILRALRATGRATPELEARTLRYLRLGYQEILPYEVAGGGFSYFGAAPQVTHLTAYGLLELTDMSSLIEVDEALLMRLRKRLAEVQDAAGGFGGPAESAYVTMALLESDPDWNAKEDPKKPWAPDVRAAREATKRAVAYLKSAFSVTDGVDSYALAMAASAFVAAGPEYREEAGRLLDVLDSRATVTTLGGKRLVSFRPAGGTLYGSYGASAEVETTALVAYALVKIGDRPEKAREALRALMTLRGERGGFYSTQGTVLALRALLAAAESQTVKGKALILVDGNEVAEVVFDGKNADVPQVVNLTDKVKNDSEIVISTGDWTDLGTDVAYRLSLRYYEPWERPAAGGPIEVIGETEPTLSLEIYPGKTSFVLGDQTTVRAELTRGGGGGTRGMILVELGLPPGFRLTPEAMSRLQSNYAVRRVEPLPRGVALYLDDPGAGTLEFEMPIVAARGVNKVWLPRSRAYFYYQPQIEAQAAPILLNVTSPKIR